MKSQLNWRYVAAIWISGIVLGSVTFLIPATHLIGGLDDSWAYTLNLAFDNGWVMGRDIYFTFGPLGFLEHTRVVSLDLLYASFIFSFLISVAMNILLLHLAFLSGTGKLQQLFNLSIAVTIIVFSFPHMQRLLVCGYTVVFLHWLTGRHIYLLLLGLVVSLCVLVKFSYGTVALPLLCAYGLLIWWKKCDWVSLWILLAGLVVSYWGLWWLIYGHLEGSIGYLQGALSLSKGNAAAMALNPENNWYAIAAFYTTIIFAGLSVHYKSQRQFAWLPLVFILPLLVWTKYTFTRQDSAHMFPIMAFAAYFMGLCVMGVSELRHKLMIVVLVVFSWYAWIAMHTQSIGMPDYRNAPHNTLNKPEIVRYSFQLDRLADIWKTAEEERLAHLLMHADMRKTIGNSQVDIYPWELTIASINKLNWHPRPVFQTLVTFLPFLDKKNSDFYDDDDRAPEYIVWHHHLYQDIMNRYSLSTEPMTVESIINHYELLNCQGYFCLWKRTGKPQIESTTQSDPVIAHWNEWIDVPEKRGDVLRVKLAASRTFLGELNLAAWKEGDTYIDYQLKNGATKTHQLLIDNAVSGIWVSPYVETYLGSASTRPEEISQKKIKNILSRPSAWGYVEKIEMTMSGQHVVGWVGIAGTDTTPSESYLLFYNDDKAFLFASELYDRSDVVSALAAEGKAISSKTGIDDEVNERLLPAGNYQVRLVLKQDGLWAATPDQGFAVQSDPALKNRNDVSRIRIRTSRPWAFSKEVELRWQQLSLRGQQ